MKIRLLAILLLSAACSAQTHTSVTVEDNQTVTGNKTFNGSTTFGADVSLTTHALTAGSVNSICFASGTGSDGGIATCLAQFGAAPACGWIVLPRGVTNISSTMDFTNREGCKLVGHGQGQTCSSAATCLKWTGASGGTLLKWSSIRWSSAFDFTIDGNSLAGRAIDFTAVNAVGASQKDVFERITILGVTQSPSQNIHIGSSTNDQISESAFIDVNHMNCVTCYFAEGTQTGNVRFQGGMVENYTAFGFDFEGGVEYEVQQVDFEDTISTGVSVKGADLAALGTLAFIDDYFEELNTTNVAYSFPSGAGSRHQGTTIIGNRILYPNTTTSNVVFDFEQHANLVMVGTVFTSNAPGQGGTITLSAVGGTPNINTFNQVTLQNSWSIGTLGSNSVLIRDNAAPTLSNASAMEIRNGGINLWSGSIQFSDATGVAKYRFDFNSSEYRIRDGSNNILGGWLGAGTATTGTTPWKANHFKADTGYTLASGTEITGQTGTGTNWVTDTSPTIGGTPNIGRVKTTGSAPTSCAVTGAGASGACAVIASSSDSFALLQIQAAGAGPAATGTLSMTFSASLGGARAVCVAFPSNTSSGSWQTTGVQFTTTGGTNTGPTFNWSNNAVALTAASNYNVGVLCFGQ